MSEAQFPAMKELVRGSNLEHWWRIQEMGLSYKRYKKEISQLAVKYGRKVTFDRKSNPDGVIVTWDVLPPIIGDIWERILDGRRVRVLDISGPIGYNHRYRIHWAHETNPYICISAPDQEFFMKKYRLISEG